MKALIALTLLVSAYAHAECDLIEDPPISEVNCNLQLVTPAPTGSEWTRLFYNPSSIGLNSSGTMQAVVNLQLSTNDALVAKVEATTPLLDKNNTVRAAVDASTWVDAIVHRNSTGNVLELIRYRYVEGKVQQQASVFSSQFGTTASTAFGINTSYAAGTVTVNITSGTNNAVVATLVATQFGQTLPSMRLRRGVQPVGSGVLSASFANTVN